MVQFHLAGSNLKCIYLYKDLGDLDGFFLTIIAGEELPPKTTLWKLEDHTLGNHFVLKNNGRLDAGWNGRVLLYAFAGPGKYEGGQDGSQSLH